MIDFNSIYEYKKYRKNQLSSVFIYIYQYMQNLRPNGPSLEITAEKSPGWYAQHSIDPEAELEDVELLGFQGPDMGT